MREIIKNLNKRALADGTGISYSRLRKYAASQINELTQEEKDLIYNYLQSLSSVFKGENKNDKTELWDSKLP